MSRDVGTGFGFRQGECRQGLAADDPRQVSVLQFDAAGERDRAAAQALHRKREIREPVEARQRFTDEGDGAHIEVRGYAAMTGAHAVTQ